MRRTLGILKRAAALAVGAAALTAALLACNGDDEPAGPSGSGPRILSVSPPRAVTGQSVQLLGSGFGSDATRITITIGGATAPPLSVSETVVEALVPDGVAPGEAAILLTVAGGGQAVSTLTVLGPGPTFGTISPGGGFTCGIVRGGGAYCWGSGIRGQLGVGTDLNHSPVPLPVVGGGAFQYVSASRVHACALDAGGAAFCWGQNGSGQLGEGSNASSMIPVPVRGDLRFASVTAGSFHTCALTAAGEAYCWGENRFGQLGTGDTLATALPAPVSGGLRFQALSAGGSHTCGLTAGGAAYCWGDNHHGELGDGGAATSAVPRPVSGGLSFAALSAGRPPAASSNFAGGHTCALTRNGAAYCWGFNNQGQLGDGTENDSPAPVPVATGVAFRTISAGSLYTCGVTTEDNALCWGANDAGQLGGGLVNTRSSLPVPVIGRLRFETVSAGSASKGVLSAGRPHTCGLTSAGTAFCWGRNDSGQLGSGTATTQSVPLPVVGP
jgi:alpha-tubulin suppressor-like RCC1 family protein